MQCGALVSAEAACRVGTSSMKQLLHVVMQETGWRGFGWRACALEGDHSTFVLALVMICWSQTVAALCNACLTACCQTVAVLLAQPSSRCMWVNPQDYVQHASQAFAKLS